MTDAGNIAAIMAGLNMAVTLFGGGIFVGIIKGRLDRHDADTKRIETSVEGLRSLLVSSAVEADRLRRAEADIENLEDDVRKLRRGVGWIKDEGARGVDREY